MKKGQNSDGLSVLVVDDDEDIRVLLSKALNRIGHHVSQAKSAEQALEMLQRSYFHVVITDIQMASMTGVELMREIKAINETIQIYIITAHSNLEKVIQCMKGGAYDFFEKPLKVDDIITSINEASRRATRWGELYKRHSFSRCGT